MALQYDSPASSAAKTLSMSLASVPSSALLKVRCQAAMQRLYAGLVWIGWGSKAGAGVALGVGVGVDSTKVSSAVFVLGISKSPVNSVRRNGEIICKRAGVRDWGLGTRETPRVRSVVSHLSLEKSERWGT